MSRAAPPGKEAPRLAGRGARTRAEKIVGRKLGLAKAKRKQKQANTIADPAETKDQLIWRLLREEDFPNHIIHRELVEYEALLKLNGRPFVNYRFIERLLAARRYFLQEVALAQLITKTLFTPKQK